MREKIVKTKKRWKLIWKLCWLKQEDGKQTDIEKEQENNNNNKVVEHIEKDNKEEKIRNKNLNKHSVSENTKTKQSQPLSSYGLHMITIHLNRT